MATATIKANRIFREPISHASDTSLCAALQVLEKSRDTAQHYILRLLSDKGRNLLCVRKADVTNRGSTFAGVASGHLANTRRCVGAILES